MVISSLAFGKVHFLHLVTEKKTGEEMWPRFFYVKALCSIVERLFFCCQSLIIKKPEFDCMRQVFLLPEHD